MWMQRNLFLILFITLSLIAIAEYAHPQITFSVNTTPSAFNIPRSAATAQNIVYTFSTQPAGDISLKSSQGIFLAGSTVIGIVNIPLAVSIKSGAGSVSELLNIPVSVSKKAENLGTMKITYERTFTDGAVSGTAQAGITVTTAAAAAFKIQRLQLYFENRRAEITVKKNLPSLIAYADIKFAGSGLLEGFWEVDGRMLSQVRKHLVYLAYGSSVTLETPAIPPLPTFESGTHRVRFVITNPMEDITLPESIYFVTEEKFRDDALPVRLIAPGDNAEITFSPTTFQWEKKKEGVIYLVEFFQEGGDRPIFSALCIDAVCKLPEPALKDIFSRGTA
jgi:hypothetical protein